MRTHPNNTIALSFALAAFSMLGGSVAAADLQPIAQAFLKTHCVECHDADDAKGGLDLTALKFDLNDPKIFAKWVTVHDRVRDGEMPPKKRKVRPDAAAITSFITSIAQPLAAADREHYLAEGRSTWRRLNRFEYENSLRDLLGAPWLRVKEILPEDGEAFRFNKVGDALDVSHVQMAQYLAAADYALHQVLPDQLKRPEGNSHRYYARDMNSFSGHMKFTEFNRSPERATFPVLGFKSQPDVRSYKQPLTVGSAKPEIREQEAMGVVASSYEPIEMRFDSFKAPEAGHYKLRFSAYSVWVGPGKEPKWWTPDLDTVSRGRRSEPITVYSETKPRLLRWLGAFDVQPDPGVADMDVWLLKGETIRVDAARLFRSRPPNWHNPLAEKDGQPGVAFKWLEVDGPLLDAWPSAGSTLLFGDLPLKAASESGSTSVEVDSKSPDKDSERLLRGFMQKAYRRPVADADVQRFLNLIRAAMKSGTNFTDAMLAGYSAVLCSPQFVCLEEKPGPLDDNALAARLSYFLSNSTPDTELRATAARGELHKPEVLHAQAERLLNDPKIRRFNDAFLDYWLDLRRLNATTPDAGLYPDYYLDDLLIESSLEETQNYFLAMLREDLPVRNVAASDFAFVNERLATHYNLPPVEGVQLRRVKLPPDSPRGGLMTQASVLKVTANGTTTSPVLRGAWIMERILGKPPPPPPPSVPAVEPDIRGASTIREQLEKHRSSETCSACHAKIDPPGFALESFDVMGGWRDNYRALGEGKHVHGFGKNGQPFEFHAAQPVDASGELPAYSIAGVNGGGAFKDIREFKQVLLKDERQLARNMVKQFVVYATGAPVRFGDRQTVEAILDRAAPQYGVRKLIHEIVQSDLFQRK